MFLLENIRKAFERNATVLSSRPLSGLHTYTSRTRVLNGLCCEVTEGNWQLRSDMPEAAGGGASAPAPGMYGRAALGSCLAITYMMYASKAGIAVDSLEIEVQADSDDGGLFGTTENPAGYTAVRYTVIMKSHAPDAVIRAMLDEADRHSPYLNIFKHPQQLHRAIIINP